MEYREYRLPKDVLDKEINRSDREDGSEDD